MTPEFAARKLVPMVRSVRLKVGAGVLALCGQVHVIGCLDTSVLTEGGPRPTCDGGACDGGSGVLPTGDAASQPTPDAALVCKAGDVTTFAPQWKPPKNRQTVCTAGQVDSFAGCFFGPAANSPTCVSFVDAPTNALCRDCLLSDITDAAYGPFVKLGTDAITANVEGCVALVTGQKSASGCGAKAQALAQCTAASCGPTCPVSTHAQVVEYTKCLDAAGKTTCKSYATAAECIKAELAPGQPAEGCASGASIELAAAALGKFFCSP